MLGKIEGRRRRGCQRIRWLDGIADAMDMNLGELQETARDREAEHAAVYGVTKSRTHWVTEQQHSLHAQQTIVRCKCNFYICTVKQ